MARSQPRRLAGRRAIDRHDLDAQRSERSVDLAHASGSQRTDDHLGVDARSGQELVTVALGGLEQPAGSGVMRVVPVEEPNQDVGVERYRSHSSRSRSR